MKKLASVCVKAAKKTFVWVTLVCQRLRCVKRVRNTLSVLKSSPPGALPLYDRILEQIWSLKDSEDAEDAKDFESYRQVLSSVTLSYHPTRLKWLTAIAGLEEDPDKELIDLCGSFLIIRKEVVHFVHLSAKDYFRTGKESRIFP